MKTRLVSIFKGFSKNKYSLVLIGMIGLVGAALLAWSLWPMPTGEAEFILSSMYLEGGQVELVWPATVRRGEAAEIHLSVDSAGMMVEIETSDGPALLLLSDLAADFNALFEGRLEISGSDASPLGPVRIPFTSGQRAEYDWSIISRSGSALKGTIWLYLELVPTSGDERVTVRYPVLARSLDIESRSIMGLGVFGVRGMGGMLLLMSLWLLWAYRKKN